MTDGLTVLDLLLVVALLSATIRGWFDGTARILARGVGAWVGAWLGAQIVTWVIPDRTGSHPDGPAELAGRFLLVVGGVVFGAVLLAGVLDAAARRLDRGGGRHAPRRPVWDRLVGAVGSFAVTAALLWLAATFLRLVPLPTPLLAPLVSATADSPVLREVDSMLPRPVRQVVPWFTGVLEANRLDSASDRLRTSVLRGGTPPSSALAGRPQIRRAAASVVKVTGVARACSRSQEGTGWVVAPHRVVTNAHVVSGVQRPWVTVSGAAPLAARVVIYDPRRDLAVLDVPRLQAAPLPLGERLRRGDSGVVAGYPLDGPYRLTSARVKDTVNFALTTDGVRSTRQVYALQAQVRSGNSGGPLLDPHGRVAGVVYARSATSTGTGYALTLTTAEPVLDRAAAATQTVTPGRCQTD